MNFFLLTLISGSTLDETGGIGSSFSVCFDCSEGIMLAVLGADDGSETDWLGRRLFRRSDEMTDFGAPTGHYMFLCLSCRTIAIKEGKEVDVHLSGSLVRLFSLKPMLTVSKRRGGRNSVSGCTRFRIEAWFQPILASFYWFCSHDSRLILVDSGRIWLILSDSCWFWLILASKLIIFPQIIAWFWVILSKGVRRLYSVATPSPKGVQNLTTYPVITMISLPTLSDVIRQLHEIYKIFRPIFPKKFTPLFFARKIAETIPRVLGRSIRPAINWI